MPKFEKSTHHDHKLIGSDGGQDTSACTISGHSFHAFFRKCSSFTKSKWHQKEENQQIMTIDHNLINSEGAMQNFRPFPPCNLQEMPGNLSWLMDRRTDGRTCCKPSWLVGWTNGPMYRWKEGIWGFGRTDRRTDRQPENIMPLVA